MLQSRLNAVRSEMRALGAWALVVPSADPHMSEYLAERWAFRKWISGFEGSAGTAVILADGRSALWTDSRYFLEAEALCKLTGFLHMKEGEASTPSIGSWIRSCWSATGKEGEPVIIADEESISPAQIQIHEIPEVKLVPGFFDRVWKDRPAIPSAPVRVLEDKITGRSREDKINWLVDKAREAGVGSILISALDDIAWVLNLRGSDVDFNPVFYAYLAISSRAGNHQLYIGAQKVPREIQALLKKAGVDIAPYEEVGQLKSATGKIWFSPKQTSAGLALDLQTNPAGYLAADTPVSLEKSRKNPTELSMLRDCMVEDGVALTRAFARLEAAARSDSLDLDEAGAGQILSSARAENPAYLGESFHAIVGFKANAAIVHYRAPEEGSARIEGRGLLLIDSGGQYLNGTTDITRTLVLGQANPEERELYTLVLKGHIAMSQARFPRGTSGTQLDILARQELWARGLNYGHGTGHGVGFALNVHEGPARISPLPNTVALEPGMVLSNEPGYYRSGEFGIRIENLVAVKESEFEGFLEFETLTLFPYEPDLIDPTMLTRKELSWLEDYQKKVEQALLPRLEGSDAEWLVRKLRPL